MANITKRVNKAGQTSYRIRVYVGEDVNGKQLFQSMTWTPSPTMRPTSADKESKRQALLFEEKVRQGVVSLDGKTRFEDYCWEWLRNAQISPKTREGYEYLMIRISPALGHIPLEKLQGHHIESFYRDLRDNTIKHGGGRATPTNALKIAVEKSGLSQTKIAEAAGCARVSVAKALSGEHVTADIANKICMALNTQPSKLFTFEEGKLSAETLAHYHRFIRAVLAKAKRARIVPYNVAAEHITPPKSPRIEAKYYDDNQARAFLTAINDEPDIRVRSALITTLFTGVRRGELCGLSWSDINFKDNSISITKASQYQRKQGIVEVETKTESSYRIIDVDPFVMDVLKQYKAWWKEHQLSYGPDWHGEKERLFIQDDGKPINPDTINYWLKEFIKRNNLPHITPHSLRHTFATLQIAHGVDIRTVQAQTGHAQASTLVNIYSHAVKSAQKRASSILGGVLL